MQSGSILEQQQSQTFSSSSPKMGLSIGSLSSREVRVELSVEDGDRTFFPGESIRGTVIVRGLGTGPEAGRSTTRRTDRIISGKSGASINQDPSSFRTTTTTTAADLEPRSVSIRLRGRMRTSINRESAENTSSFTEKSIFLDDTLILWRSGGLLFSHEVQTYGEPCFSFEFILPSVARLPPSFNGTLGSIRYRLRAELDLPNRLRPLRIARILRVTGSYTWNPRSLDASTPYALSASVSPILGQSVSALSVLGISKADGLGPVSVEATATAPAPKCAACGLPKWFSWPPWLPWCSHGSIACRLSVDQPAVVMGQSFDVELRLCNKSVHALTDVTFKLICKATYRAEGQVEVLLEDIPLATLQHPVPAMSPSKAEVNMDDDGFVTRVHSLKLPSYLAADFVTGNHIIRITNYLQLTVPIPAPSASLVCTIPLRICTMPFDGTTQSRETWTQKTDPFSSPLDMSQQKSPKVDVFSLANLQSSSPAKYQPPRIAMEDG
eukprot:TRINITY_DN1989_c0_g1_i2.p1 TRINITY_DN1989_c0_g1~~TRINITY_DN1989_c0_g1_i2.p1  ORF type:complete len:496 (+),score=85.41 TRINITY_DN1989_c0_g1_i2:345-1832(+)